MRSILNLFCRSPFSPLKAHMKEVERCIDKIVEVFDALQNEKWEEVLKLAPKISKLEHNADLTKNDIRNNLTKSLFLPIDKSALLEILALQDDIADNAEDIAFLLTLKKLKLPESFKPFFAPFLEKNIEAFKVAKKVVYALNELVETSFGGMEAQKVKNMIDEVAFKEHEGDLLQRKLLSQVFEHEEDFSHGDLHLWLRIFEKISDFSNLSEKLSHRIHMLLVLK